MEQATYGLAQSFFLGGKVQGHGEFNAQIRPGFILSELVKADFRFGASRVIVVCRDSLGGGVVEDSMVTLREFHGTPMHAQPVGEGICSKLEALGIGCDGELVITEREGT
jgi:hypothetical protein